jgi:Arc/MetJ family transcription regulator
MMVDVDAALLEEARMLLGVRTKREVIERALRELVRRARLARVAAHAGTVELALNQEELRRLRAER